MNPRSPAQHGTKARTNRVRVRTGCVTCRKQRVKCDEGKPACQKYIRTGRTCDGDGVWGGGSAHSSTGKAGLVAVPNNPTPSTWVLSQLPQLMNHQEHEAFDYFQRFITVKLPGVFQSEFWARLTIQASAQEPAVLHAVIALSSAQRGDSSLTLRAYNTAIRQLQGHLERQDRYAIRLTRIACMVFICLEFLRGSVAAGEVHLRNGLRLLQGLQKHDGKGGKTKRPITLGSHAGSVDDCLVEAFTRLNVLSALFGQGSHFLYHLAEEAAGSQGADKSSKFDTLGDARQSLDCLINSVYSLSIRADNIVEKHLGRYPETHRRRKRRLQTSL